MTDVIIIPNIPVSVPIRREITSGESMVSTRPTSAKTPAKAGKMFIKDFHDFIRAFLVLFLSLANDIIRKTIEIEYKIVVNKHLRLRSKS
jgi:hypothetical protein